MVTSEIDAFLAYSIPAAFGLALSLLMALALLWLTAIFVVARMRLMPPRMTDGKALYRLKRVFPADLALPYEDVTFAVDDAREGRLRLRGWWIPAPLASSRCVVICHGYADAKVGALAWAPFLHAAGYNLALYDARAHGESDGRYCTAGFGERRDLLTVIRQLKSSRPAATQQLAVLGISMGGVTALAAGALEGKRTDEAMARHNNDAPLPQPVKNQQSEITNPISALIVDSVFADYFSAGILHASLFGLPGRIIMGPATWVAAKLARADFHEVAPLHTITAQRQPTLLIQPHRDGVIAPADAQRLRERLPITNPPSRFMEAPSASHVTGLREHPALYQGEVLSFLASAMPEKCA
jgi:alpha-beta hydrolase superfamily lysophospholipase